MQLQVQNRLVGIEGKFVPNYSQLEADGVAKQFRKVLNGAQVLHVHDILFPEGDDSCVEKIYDLDFVNRDFEKNRNFISQFAVPTSEMKFVHES